MTPGARLAGFLVALPLVVAGGAAVGSAVGPIDTGGRGGASS